MQNSCPSGETVIGIKMALNIFLSEHFKIDISSSLLTKFHIKRKWLSQLYFYRIKRVCNLPIALRLISSDAIKTRRHHSWLFAVGQLLPHLSANCLSVAATEETGLVVCRAASAGWKEGKLDVAVALLLIFFVLSNRLLRLLFCLQSILPTAATT